MWPGLTVKPPLAQQNADVCERIVAMVCLRFGVSQKVIMIETKKYRFSHPRQVAMYLIRKMVPHLSSNTIGDYFGGIHRATVDHAIKTVQNSMDVGGWDKDIVQEIKEQVQEYLQSKQDPFTNTQNSSL